MNSSTGFKKRSLLRPMSGINQKEKQFLRSLDISQSEPMIASQLKNELMRIQDEISQLDKDKKIRSGQSSLQRSYALMIKKWLREGQNAFEKEDEDGKILKQMGVDTYEAGFRKLWKILVNFDHIVSKITELEIIQFLKYDESFNQVCTDSQKSSQLLNTIGKAGFVASTFQISQILLQRNKDLYSSILQSKRKGSSFVTSITSTQKAQKIQKSSSQSNRSQTNELIAQLQKQNSKLADMLQELQKQKQNQSRQIKQIKSKQVKESSIKQSVKINNGNYSSISSSSTNPQDIFVQLEERYRQKIAAMTSQIQKLQIQLAQIKIKLSGAQSLLKISQQQLKSKQFQTKAVKAGSYEQALQQQMQKMKKGFEKKISKLSQEFNQKEKDMRKKQIDYRNQNEKIKWEKSLLLKKFQTLTSVK